MQLALRPALFWAFAAAIWFSAVFTFTACLSAGLLWLFVNY